MDKQYKYDAFISYRHTDLDKFVAENLHRILESYELPKNIKEKLNIEGRTIKRVFRDQEELPLSSNLEDPIVDALNNSKYLIVICSPRLKESMWCKKEIETFKKIRGRKNIFCVLIEGEPKDSFPEEVLFDEKEVKLKNGKIKKEKILVEPLAADVRAETKKEVLKKIKEEKLRLIAPMYNLDYDDLKQRHKMQEQRKKLITASIVSISCLIFALYTSIMLIKISSQQKVLKKHQALSLSNEAYESLKKDSRYDAIKKSYQALTNFNGLKMPYTSEAEYALSESLGVYDAGISYKAISEIKTKGVIDFVKSSENYKYLALYDESEELTLWNANTLKNIDTFNDVSGFSFDEYDFTFIGNDYLSYINKSGNIVIYSIKDKKKIKEIKKEEYSFSSVKGNNDGTYLVFINENKLSLYNVKEDKIIGNYESDNDFMKEIYFSEDSKYLFSSTSKKNYDINTEDYMTVHVFDTSDLNEVNNVELNAGYISGMIVKDNNVYMLLNRSIGVNFNLLIVSYNYIDNNINWTKTSDGNWGKYITRSYADNTNSIAVVNGDKLNVLDENTGELKESFNMKSEIINVYSYINSEIYLLFNKEGTVNYVNMENRMNLEYLGMYELNLDRYIKVTKNKNGYLLVPENENRIIYYGANSNKKIKEVKIDFDYVEDDSFKVKDDKKIKKQYNIKNKNLVSKIFYSTKKDLLFVSYTDDSFAIYDTKTKKLLNIIDDIEKANHYYGKDKYGRIYVGNISNAYIIDNNYNKVGHIKNLAKLDSKNNKVIVTHNEIFYSIPIYTLDDLLNQAKNYLK